MQLQLIAFSELQLQLIANLYSQFQLIFNASLKIGREALNDQVVFPGFY